MRMDVWRWLEDADGIYSVKAVYKEIMGKEAIFYQQFINLLFFAQEDALYGKLVSTFLSVLKIVKGVDGCFKMAGYRKSATNNSSDHFTQIAGLF